MNNRRTSIRDIVLLIGLAALLSADIALAQEDLSDGIYNVAITDQELNEIQTLLPEYGGVDPAFVNNDLDPNIHLTAEAEVFVTFIDEGAGYKNTFGYFVYDDDQNVLYEQTIFSNASETGGGGTLNPGDTVSLGTFEEGTNIGFWVQANGYNDPEGHTYYTIDEMNPDGKRHIAIINTGDELVTGFEDLYNLGDQDYNDVVFTVTASPYDAIDTSAMPTGSPEAGPMATAIISLLIFGFTRRKQWGM